MVRISPSLRSISHADGTVILDIENGTIMTLNATGSFIWERLREGRQPDEITREIAIETGEDPSLIDQHLRSFLDELAKRHLLTSRDENGNESYSS